MNEPDIKALLSKNGVSRDVITVVDSIILNITAHEIWTEPEIKGIPGQMLCVAGILPTDGDRQFFAIFPSVMVDAGGALKPRNVECWASTSIVIELEGDRND